MTAGLPTFSIVINTLNRAAYLDDAIAGVLQLDYPEFELVVVNGPSTDNTTQVLERWADKIKIGNCDVANLSVSRNVGIAAAAGDVVALTVYRIPGLEKLTLQDAIPAGEELELTITLEMPSQDA